MQTVLQGVSISRTIKIMRQLVYTHKNDLVPYKNLSLKQFFNVVKKLPYDAKEFETGEILKRPKITLSQGGDCDDKAILMAAFLQAFPQKALCSFNQFFITADFGKGEAHIFNGLLCDRSNWKYIDATYAKNQINKVYSNPKKLKAYKIWGTANVY